MKKSKILAILGALFGTAVIVFGFMLKNSWQVCAGTYIVLWVYEAYQNHQLMRKLTQALLCIKDQQKPSISGNN
jgi:hypothetical protein